MTKRDLVVKIAREINLNQSEVAETVQKTLDYIAAELIAGRTIELRNFGVFEIKVRKSRVGRNPNQPENKVTIPERAVVKFRAGKDLKEAVEKLFEGAKVESVNTMNLDGKTRRRGMVFGKTAKTKKAIVQLTEDSKDIEIFAGL